MTGTRPRPRPRTRAARAIVAPLALAAALTLTSCTSDDGDDVASADDGAPPAADPGGAGEGDTTDEGDELDRALAFAQCMRDEGIDMADPASADIEGITAAFMGVAQTHDPTEIRSAVEACRELLPSSITEYREQLDPASELELAECLREEGIDVGDDLFSGDGLPEGVSRDELATAMDECRGVLE